MGYTEGAPKWRLRPLSPGSTGPGSTTRCASSTTTGSRIEETTVGHSRPGLAKITAMLRRHGVTSGRDRTRRRAGGGAPDPRRVRGGGDLRTSGEVAAGPLRVSGQQGRPVRRVRAGRRAAHRRRPVGHRAARQRGDGRAPDAGARPPRPGRSPDRGGTTSSWRCCSTTSPARSGCSASSTSRISLAFLRRFPSEAKAAWLCRAADGALAQGQRLLRPPHPGRSGRPPAQAATGRVTGPAAEASELVVLTLVDLLTTLRAQQAALEARIKEALLAHPDGPIFQSLPRAGTVRAATLLAEIGDCRARFPDPAALAAAAGVAPSTRQSGKHLTVAYRRGCNKQLRAALIDWAQDTPRANAWARRHLPTRPRPRLPTPPRSPDPGPSLDPDPVALLARPHALQPRPTRPAQHTSPGGCLT